MLVYHRPHTAKNRTAAAATLVRQMSAAIVGDKAKAGSLFGDGRHSRFPDMGRR